MMKHFLCIAILLLGEWQAYGQLGLGASPMVLQYDAPRGGTQNLHLTISNPGKKLVNIGVSLMDWRRDSLGNILYVEPGSLKNSCSAWLQILPSTQFTLKPSEQKEVMVILKVPDQAVSSSMNSMVFFTQLNSMKAPPKKGINILLTVRVGVQVFYTPPGLSKKNIEITDFKDTIRIENDSVRRRVLQLTLHNTGEVETDGKVDFALNNLETGEKNNLIEKKFYTLPGDTLLVLEDFPVGIPAGNYSITALVDYGPEYELKIGELQYRQR